SEFATAFDDAFATFGAADKHLERCGLLLPKPEGWGFFHSRASQRDYPTYPKASSDGHRAPEVKQLKKTEDAVFSYVLTWLTGGRDKGWTVHLRPKHPPVSPEIRGAFEYLGGFSDFVQCPEFDFERCLWR